MQIVEAFLVLQTTGSKSILKSYHTLLISTAEEKIMKLTNRFFDGLIAV